MARPRAIHPHLSVTARRRARLRNSARANSVPARRYRAGIVLSVALRGRPLLAEISFAGFDAGVAGAQEKRRRVDLSDRTTSTIRKKPPTYCAAALPRYESRWIVSLRRRARRAGRNTCPPIAVTRPNSSPRRNNSCAKLSPNSRPRRVLDVGANTGHFSEMAARAGASVVAIDGDTAVVGDIWRRASAEKLDILPLVVNLAQPTPPTGWRNRECPSFLDRATGQSFESGDDARGHLTTCSRPNACRCPKSSTSPPISPRILRSSNSWISKIPCSAACREAATNCTRISTPISSRQSVTARFDIVRQRTLTGSHRTLYLLRVRQWGATVMERCSSTCSLSLSLANLFFLDEWDRVATRWSDAALAAPPNPTLAQFFGPCIALSRSLALTAFFALIPVDYGDGSSRSPSSRR